MKKNYKWILNDIFISLILIAGKIFNTQKFCGIAVGIVLIFYIISAIVVIFKAIDDESFVKKEKEKLSIQKKAFSITRNIISYTLMAVLFYFMGYKYNATYEIILMVLSFSLIIIFFSNKKKEDDNVNL